MNTPARPDATVYYDGDCPVCSREIALYRRLPGAERLHWVDAARCPPEALGDGLERGQALARLHVRTADDALVSGAAAFVEIWRRLHGARPLARLAALPPVLAVLELGYRAFLAARRRWRRAGRPFSHPQERP